LCDVTFCIGLGLVDTTSLAGSARLGMISTLLHGPPLTDLEVLWAPMLASPLLRGGLEAATPAVGASDDAPSGDGAASSTGGGAEATVSSTRNMDLVRCIVEDHATGGSDSPSESGAVRRLWCKGATGGDGECKRDGVDASSFAMTRLQHLCRRGIPCVLMASGGWCIS
jgi:hypothetical protein